MDIVKIQTLIAQGKVVNITDINPAQSFVQIGIYQPDNRKIGSANNSYPPFVIPLSELGGNQDLATTLAIGNTTGANWIDVDSGYGLTGDDGGTISSTIKIDPLNSNPIHSQVLDTSNYHNSNIKQTPEEVIIYTMDNDAGGTSITVGLTTITIRSFDNPVLIEGNTAEYAVDYSSIYTNRSLVDKEYVDNNINSVKNILNATIDLNTTADQIITLPATGNYIIDKVYVHSATINLYSDPSSNLQVIDGVDVILQSKEDVPGGYEQLNSLLAPANYMYLQYTPVPPCWPPPCNINRILAGGNTLIIKMGVASAVPATVKISIVLYNID